MIKHFKFNPFGSIRRHPKYVDFSFENVFFLLLPWCFERKKERDSRLPNMISGSERQE